MSNEQSNPLQVVPPPLPSICAVGKLMMISAISDRISSNDGGGWRG